MAPTLTPNIERVMERFVFEKILLHNRIQGRRRRITLKEVLEAARREPRIFEVLPAVLRLKPQMISKSKRDLNGYPELKKLIENFEMEKAPSHWQGIPIHQLREQEKRLYELWQHRHRKTKWVNINIRVSNEDMERLNALAQSQSHGNKSEIIRRLIAQADDSTAL